MFERACAHCHGGPGQSTTQPPVIRFHDINTQCPRPVDTVTPARFAFAPCPPDLERNARTYEITLANGTKMRRTSSDPGRALLTGIRRRPAADRRLEQVRRPGASGHPATPRPTSTTTARRRWKRRRSLHRVLQAGASDRPSRRAAGRVDRRRALRSPADAGRAPGAAGVSAKAVGRRVDSQPLARAMRPTGLGR